MSDTPSHPYDTLTPVKIMFFFAMILVINLVVLVVVFPFYVKAPFSSQLHKEQASMSSFYGHHIFGRIQDRADGIYDSALVNTGIERWTYNLFLDNGGPTDLTADINEKVQNVFKPGRAVDNVMDYLLLMSFRFSAILVLGSVGFALMIAIMLDALIRRNQRRYGFGDSSVIANVLSRGAVSYAIPVFLIVVSLPVALHPVVVITILIATLLAVALFFASVPKLA